MAEDTIKVEEATEQSATVETNEVDYDKELEIAAEKQKNAEFATRRIAEKQVKKEEDNDDSDSIADKVIAKVLPALKLTAESSALEGKLDRVAGANESLKKLIKFHYENSVNPNMGMDERVEAAYAIANKKAIDKTVKEINVARTNRSQISNVGQGSNQETYSKPGQNVLSDAQINELKAKAKMWGLDEKRFIENTIKRLSQ